MIPGAALGLISASAQPGCRNFIKQVWWGQPRTKCALTYESQLHHQPSAARSVGRIFRNECRCARSVSRNCRSALRGPDQSTDQSSGTIGGETEEIATNTREVLCLLRGATSTDRGASGQATTTRR